MMVDFKGHTGGVQEIWKHNHAFLLPSRQEGMSLALIEAMMCGRVPVVTDVGGATEVIEDNVSGFIALASHPQLLDEALERAWACRANWEEIGKCAYDRIHTLIKENPSKVLMDRIVASIK
jgi:glycosyltransferase involved in cell wall biosynthesis